MNHSFKWFIVANASIIRQMDNEQYLIDDCLKFEKCRIFLFACTLFLPFLLTLSNNFCQKVEFFFYFLRILFTMNIFYSILN